MSTPYKILVGDTDTPQSRVPKSGEQTYLAPVTIDDATGVEQCFEIEVTVQQSGTAGYTGHRVSVTETSVGTGAKKLYEGMVGGASVFSVDSNGALACGALTSSGIDDGATARRLWLGDIGMWLGPADDDSEFAIFRDKVDSKGSISILGGYIEKDSALVRVYGRYHPTQGGDVEIGTSNKVIAAHYDYSATTWDFQANSIVTTGDLTCAGLTSTGIDDNATGRRVLMTDADIKFGNYGEDFEILKPDSAGTLGIFGGSASGQGSGVLLHGSADADAYDISFVGFITSELYYDHSASEWDFKANNIATTGDILPGGAAGPRWTTGAGTPEGVETAVVGSMFTRTDGGAITTLYVKESGTGNTGWVAK